MHRHISKGSWTFSDQDHGWQVSDCTAEGLKVTNTSTLLSTLNVISIFLTIIPCTVLPAFIDDATGAGW